MGTITSKVGQYRDSPAGLYFAYVVNVSLLLLIYCTPLLKDTLNHCAIKLDTATTSPTSYWRGSNYLLDKTDTTGKSCLVSRWNVAHMLTYAAYGYYCPSFRWLAIGIGVLFEVLEWLVVDCHDVTDILANSLGCLTGAALALRQKHKPHRVKG